MSDIDPRRDLIACYAVGALDDDERAEVTRLIDPASPDFDAALYEELQVHLEVLAAMAPEVAPPNELLDRILADLPAPEAADRAPSTETVVPFERPTARRAGSGPVIRLVLAAAAVVALIVIGVGLVRDDQPADLNELALAAMDDPDAEVVSLAPPTGGESVARAAMFEDGSGYLVVDGLPELAPSESYQLWMLPSDGSEPISLGLVDPGDDGATAFRMDPGAQGIAVSREPAGGSVVPTEVVASGTVA